MLVSHYTSEIMLCCHGNVPIEHWETLLQMGEEEFRGSFLAWWKLPAHSQTVLFLAT